MRTWLALHNLFHNWTRTVAAVGGVTFAVVLIFMQFGFWGAALKTATVIYDTLDYDILLRSPQYVQFAAAKSFPLQRLVEARQVPGVRSTSPLYISGSTWRSPESLHQSQGNETSDQIAILGRTQPILLLGVNPQASTFNRGHSELQTKSAKLTSASFLLIDRESSEDFGPADGKRFGDGDVNRETEVGGRRVKIIGHVQLGAGLMAGGSALTSDTGLCRLTPGRSIDDISLGLVTLQSGASAEETARKLNEFLPPDICAVTKQAVETEEKDYWVYKQPVGMIFLAGAIVALIVGVVVVYQVLTSDISHQISEYATLKAMGYSDWFLRSTVLQQAFLLAVIGFAVGCVLSWGLYEYVRVQTNMPVTMEAPRAALVFVLTVAMCLASGFLSVRKLQGADPADLFA